MAIEEDIDVLAKTVWAEARGEGINGMVAVGWTIRNRVDMDLHKDGKPDWWGEGIPASARLLAVLLLEQGDPNYPYLAGEREIPPGQLLQAREAALAVIYGQLPDPTGGATHYYATSMPKPPAWAPKATRTKKIGRHVFFKDVP